MKKKIQRYIKVIFVLAVTLTSISSYPNNTLAEEAELGNEDIKISLNQKYNEETNTESIEISVQPELEGVQVLDVINPEGNSLQLNENIYSETVIENGENEFTVKYLSVDDEQKEYKFVVQTSSIQEEIEEVVEAEHEKQDIHETIDKQPRIDVNNGSVRVEIKDYEENNGWPTEGDKNKKVMEVYVQFDTTNTDTTKQLDITLPAGMRYTEYQMPNPSGSLEKAPVGDLENQIIGATRPDSNDKIGPAQYGTLSYKFGEGTENVKIEVEIAVDENTITKNTIIPNGISIEAAQDDNTIGLIEKDIVATRGEVRPYFWGSSNEVIALEDQETIELPRYYYFPGTVGTYYSSLELTYYYPSDFKLKGFTLDNNCEDYEVDEEEGSITFKYENIYAGNPDKNLSVYGPIISLDGTGVSAGTYTVDTIPKVVAYNFQGEKVEQSTTHHLGMKPIIRVKGDIENKLMLDSEESYFYDSQSDYYTKGPLFRLTNDTVTEKTNQVYETKIDSNYLAVGVTIPYDKSQNPDGIKIYYKTNQNNGKWLLASESSIKHSLVSGTNGYIAEINKSSLGLDKDEYITNTKGYIGTVSKGFNSPDWSMNAPSVMGRLKDGVNYATVQVDTYAEQAGTKEEGSENSVVSSIARNSTSPTTIGRAMNSTSMVAGESKTQTITFGGGTYRYEKHTVLNSPTIYLRVPDGITYSNFKVQSLVNNVYKNVDYEISDLYTSDISGYTFIKIEVNDNFGYYFGDNLDIKRLVINFDINANIQMGTISYNWSNYAFVQDNVFTSVGMATNAPGPIQDNMDVDNDGITSEWITPIYNADYKVSAQTGLLIDTYIIPKDEVDPRAPYNGNEETAIAFKPETEATYTIDMLNNTKEDLSEIRGYIPVPKEGNNFGTNFQDNTFSWDMKLAGNPEIKVLDSNKNDVTEARKDNYKIEYSSTATNDSNYINASYGNTYSDSTSMIRLTNTGIIPNGERVIIEFPYKVNETDETVAANMEKLGTVNDFMPYYYYKSDSSSAYTKGTRVGAILSIGTIEGVVFVDNNANGLYDAGDTLVTGGTVKLFSKDNTTTTPDTTATVQYNGTYKFEGLDITEYTLDFSGIPSKFQKFTVSKLGETDESIKDQDSEVTYLGENAGKVFNVNTALLSSKSVNAGLINYQAPTINSAENLYFAKGDVKTDAQLASAAGVTTSGFFLTDKVVNQKAVNYDIVGGPYTVTLSLEDAYEAKAEHSFNVTIVDPITASGFAVSIDDLEDADFVELSNAKAYDASDPTKLKTSTVTLSSKKPTTTGVHEVTFKADNGEKKTVKVLVYSGEVTANQVINANNFTITLEDLKDADMKDLANAKAYDISNPNDIKEIDVTTVTSKPTKAGKYDITFTTAGGATKTVSGLITEKAPTIKNEVVTATGFQIKLEDVAEADFITLANAKGYDVSDVDNIKDVEVTMTTSKPTTVGIHTVRFETENGAFTEIEVLVTNNDPTGPKEDGKMEVVVAEGFKIDIKDVAEADFKKLANAKGYSYPQNDISDRKEIEITMVSEKPTVVGIHTVRFETESGTYAEINVQVYKQSGGNEEKGKIYANDFGYSLDSGELTADKAKQLAQVSAENVAEADIEVTKADLDAINEAIENKEVNVIYSLTFTTPKGSSVTVSVTLYENGSSKEDEYIYGNGFTHKISEGNLTKEQVKELANILVKKESGEVVSNDGVAVNQEQLEAINEAITNNVTSDTKYPLTFVSPKGSQLIVQVSLVQNQITIIDDFRGDDGIIVIYRTDDTSKFGETSPSHFPEGYSYTHSLKLQIDGKDITEAELSKVTWTIEAVGGFNTEETYVEAEAGNNIIKAKKSGVVKLTVNYEGTTSEIHVVVPGDVDRNGALNSRDSSNIQKYARTRVISDIGIEDKFTLFLANMNGDEDEGTEIINTRDSSIIQSMSRNAIPSN